MNPNSIIFTPSNEQMLELAKEHPTLNEEIKSKMLGALKDECYRYVKNGLKNQTQKVYQALLMSAEKKVFKNNGNYSYSFNEKMESRLNEEIENRLVETLEEEYKQYINSQEFKDKLKAELQKRILSTVVKNLDSQIQIEAQKLIKS